MLQEGVMRFAVWAQGDFRDEVTGGLARLDLTGHGAHTPGGSNPSTPGATPTTPSGGFSTAQPRSRTNTTHRPDIRKGTPRQFTTNFSNPRPRLRLSSFETSNYFFIFFFLFSFSRRFSHPRRDDGRPFDRKYHIIAMLREQIRDSIEIRDRSD